MVFFLSHGLQYSRLFHPDQHQKCKLKFTSVYPLFADDAQGVSSDLEFSEPEIVYIAEARGPQGGAL